MQNTDYFKDKKVTIVGLARSGVACANLLYGLGAKVFVTDLQDNASTKANAAQLKSKDIGVELGKHSREILKNSDFIVISPGVPADALPVTLARDFGIPAISEIEVGFILCPAKIIAVTGSVGKTTVTTLIGRIIEASGKKAFVCGNIGNPFCGELPRIGPEDIVVLEVSSFQLETISSFKPKIAVMLNLNRNHLDRYKDMDEYLEAKKRVFMNQESNDYLVLNELDPVMKALGAQTKSKVVYFSQEVSFNPNQSAVLSVGKLLGISQELCQEVFNDFKGLEHRMEHICEINNVRFVNDSKATTVESCVWAVKSLKGKIILIAGGKDKGVDYKLILDQAKKKVKYVILIGEAKDKIKAALAGEIPMEEALSLEEAVNKAFFKAAPGDYVLLSPMCSSFDMFSSYEERGKIFKKIVLNLKNKVTAVSR